jgi:hypothetical protein
MKTQLNEIKRMQQLAGILKEYMSVDAQGEFKDSGEDIKHKLGTVSQRSIEFNDPDTLNGKVNNLLDQLDQERNHERIEDLWNKERTVEIGDPNSFQAFYDWLVKNFERLKEIFT